MKSWSAIILAAGGSSRFGTHKLLADLAGEPVLKRTAGAVCSVGFGETIVVTGAQPDAVKSTLADLPCTVVHAAEWAAGVSASIRIGIEALPHDREGLFLFLGDMPLAPSGPCEELAALAKNMNYAARPLHRNIPGHPVAFAKEAWADLMALTGDEGAGRLLRGVGARIAYLPTGDEGTILDVDTPDDLAWAERLWKSRFTSAMIDNAISSGDLPNP